MSHSCIENFRFPDNDLVVIKIFKQILLIYEFTMAIKIVVRETVHILPRPTMQFSVDGCESSGVTFPTKFQHDIGKICLKKNLKKKFQIRKRIIAIKVSAERNK